jgi:ribosomal protein L24
MDLKIIELEKEVRNLMAKQGTCEWVTNEDKICKKQSSVYVNGHKFCSKHQKHVENFKTVDDNEICDTYSNIKLIPRSYEQVKYQMKKIKNEDNTVDIYVSKGCIEEGDVSEKEHITLLTDNCNFYYAPTRGQKNAKTLRILLRSFCGKKCEITVDDTKYCKECYGKLKNVPKIELLMNKLSI